MLNYKKIGKFLSEEREKINLTQDQLAEKIYVTRQAISSWERGIALPGYTLLISLCDLYKVTPNEILAGERIHKKNAKYVNNIIIDVLKENSKKIKKMLILNVLSVFIILFAFLIYYFVSTYNKIEVYLMNGTGNTFQLNDSLLVFSNDRFHLKLGSVVSDLYSYDFIDINYYTEDGKKCFVSTTYSDALIVQNKGYNELFDFKDRKQIINNLYIDVHYKIGNEKVIDTIKINANKLYNNDKILFNDDDMISDEGNTDDLKSNISIPPKIANEFELDEEGNYVLSYTKQKKQIIITYMPIAKMLVVQEKEKNNIEEYIFIEENGIIKYTAKDKIKEISIESVVKDKDIICSNDDCEQNRDKYEYFLKEYYYYCN